MMRRTFVREVAASGLPGGPGSSEVVTSSDLEQLPVAAQRYLRFMGVEGRARDWSFCAHLAGRFRRSAGAKWQQMDAWQYNSGPPDVARFFYLTLHVLGAPILGRDTYVRGRGRMLVRALDLVTVADGHGPEFDRGELVTWLNDAVLVAPSMLLTPAATWRALDLGSFEIGFTDAGHTVSARVEVDQRGAPMNFYTEDRWYAPADGRSSPVRTPWMTPVSGWQQADGHMLAARGQAVWRLPAGDCPYIETGFQPGDVVFNVPPAGLHAVGRFPTDRVTMPG